MENDILNDTWDKQRGSSSLAKPADIISKAKKQRNGQYISITVMAITVLILVVYAGYFAMSHWNSFTLGLILMISSLLFRVILEVASVFKKESQLISMDSKAYQNYLMKHYRRRLMINYIITPLCFGIYIYGFTLLLPYFKREFSDGFYTYLLISGFGSLAVILGIIINSVLKERRFLKELKD